MNKLLRKWDSKHREYMQSGWINQPTIFAQDVLTYLPKSGKILELGAGQGQDSRYFASKGYSVTATDFSDVALKFNKKKTPTNLKNKIEFLQFDLNNPFLFPAQTFDVVYSHLSVHYFDKQTTNQIFNEIYRVLKPKGLVALIINSVSDPEYKTGKELEEDYFELPDGMSKRFFSVESLTPFVTKFRTIVQDNKGETHKDLGKDITNLIRFIGRKVV